MTESKNRLFSLSIITKEQYRALTDLVRSSQSFAFSRLYLSSDLVLGENDVLSGIYKAFEGRTLPKMIISLPEVIRSQDESHLRKTLKLIDQNNLSGVLTGSLEGVGFFKGKCPIYGDHNLYLWNTGAVSEWKSILAGGCLPLELNRHDQRKLLEADFSWEKLIYGRIPMMLTANCIAKTNGACRKAKTGSLGNPVNLIDRMDAKFPVRLVCDHCFNVIYNSVPLSLHDELGEMPGDLTLRIQLTIEDYEQSLSILRFFMENPDGRMKIPMRDYTKGREKRGAQ